MKLFDDCYFSRLYSILLFNESILRWNTTQFLLQAWWFTSISAPRFSFKLLQFTHFSTLRLQSMNLWVFLITSIVFLLVCLFFGLTTTTGFTFDFVWTSSTLESDDFNDVSRFVLLLAIASNFLLIEANDSDDVSWLVWPSEIASYFWLISITSSDVVDIKRSNFSFFLTCCWLK